MRMYHPESPPLREHDSSSPPADPESPTSQSHPIPLSDDENRTLPHSTLLSRLLSERVPQVKYPSPVHKSSGRVLTSSENLLRLEEKQKEKEAAAEERQGRKEEREQKRLALQKEKERKALERERKREEKLKLKVAARGRQAGSASQGLLPLYVEANSQTATLDI